MNVFFPSLVGLARSPRQNATAANPHSIFQNLAGKGQRGGFYARFAMLMLR